MINVLNFDFVVCFGLFGNRNIEKIQRLLLASYTRFHMNNKVCMMSSGVGSCNNVVSTK